MKITAIPQLYRNANRWRDIIGVLSKYGLAGWLGRFELPIAGNIFRDADGELIARLSHEARIRRALEELGPTFIKLGQILSTRPDLVGVPLADELSLLQSGAPADRLEWVRAVIEEDLCQPLEECFAEFETEPVASASIGQVHRAKLVSGHEVAVKVRHEHIERRVGVDTDIMMGLAALAERIPELQNYRPVATAAEFQRIIRRELDFSHERRRLEQFAGYFDDDARVCVPPVHPELCSKRVLATQWLDGYKVSDPRLHQDPSVHPEVVARNGAEAFLSMVIDHGVYHADPHPGNLIVMPGDVLGLVDFGMVGRLSDSLREDLEDMLSAITSNDPAMLTLVVMRVGAVPAELDEAALSSEIADFVDHYGNQAVGEFDVTGALKELINIIRRYHIVLPASIGMLLKMLVMLEGAAQMLSPEFTLIEVLRPMQRRMTLRRFSPARQARKLRRFYYEAEQLAETLPRRLGDILQQVQTGTFDVHLDHRGLEPSVNRLVLGMLASALYVGSSWMVSNGVLPLGFWPLEGVSAPGLVGCTLAVLLGLRVLRAISKSGRLERKR